MPLPSQKSPLNPGSADQNVASTQPDSITSARPASDTQATETSASRRGFLKTGALVGVASSSVSQTFLARTANAAGSDEIKVGLIGCGGRGRGAATNATNADEGATLTHLADMFPEAIEITKKTLAPGLKSQYAVDEDSTFVGWDAYKRVMDSDVDVVILTTPPFFRPMQLDAAVDAGKHIFCEKPVAVDPVGVRRVMETSKRAAKANLNLVSGLCWRYDAGVKATVEKIKSGAIGDIVAIQENYLTGTLWSKERKDDWTDMHNQLANWLYFRWLSGDHINEQFIHSLDKSLWLHDDEPPEFCYGQGGRQVRTEERFGDVYDHFSVVYQWADGTRTYAATRQMSDCFNQTEDFVYGTKGVAKVLAHQIQGETNWKYEHPGGERKPSMYDLEHVALFNAIREGKAINNGEYMCRSTMMAVMGREACYSGSKITWEDMMKSEQDFTPASLEFGPAPKAVVNQPGSYKFS
jgi:predicted dehydrogenase